MAYKLQKDNQPIKQVVDLKEIKSNLIKTEGREV
jgi:hypothetical protein